MSGKNKGENLMKRISCYDNVTVNEIGVTIIENGIKTCIRFNECANNYAKEKSIQESKCVALRDITKRTFVFYTSPKTILIFKASVLKYLRCQKRQRINLLACRRKLKSMDIQVMICHSVISYYL